MKSIMSGQNSLLIPNIIWKLLVEIYQMFHCTCNTQVRISKSYMEYCEMRQTFDSLRCFFPQGKQQLWFFFASFIYIFFKQFLNLRTYVFESMDISVYDRTV